MDMRFAACVVAVAALMPGFERDHVKLAVAHAAFGHQGVGEALHVAVNPLRITDSRQFRWSRWLCIAATVRS